MKRKDVDEVNDHFFDFTLSSPATKIRRLDAELAPIIDEQEALNSMACGQSIPFQDNFMEQSMEDVPIAIDELSNSVPVNEERAIVLFNPNNNTPLLQTPAPFSISTDSHFISRFKNPVIWSNGLDTLRSLAADESQKQDDNSGVINGCLAVVPWVPNQSQHLATPEFNASGAQTSDMMDSDAMDVEDNHNTQPMPKHNHVTPSATQDWSQWQQHCMVQQPPSDFSTPITWLG
ncbi:hypothetical protein QVD17_26160 [Tagetes erecta]|uniref:Uncharacterized protein n=1 Tax=Tagetes erecta TaxID=13708 RepID=A0AAD8K8F4_TARER|nr:hypothetical protein QVD17_26160 [Tagetes erecta]